MLRKLHGNEEFRRHEFPATSREIFLAHAGVSPLPRRVAEAMRNYLETCALTDQEEALPQGLLPGIRKKASRLLGVSPEEIALIGPTSTAISVVALGLDLAPGERVLICGEDFPSNVYPWLALRERGAIVERIPTPALGRVEPEAVLEAMDGRTRLVAVSSAHFLSGWRTDIEALGRELNRRGALLCVDAIQSLGAFPLRASCADFVAAGAHKWLLGPCGAGLLFVRKERQELLKPRAWGWHNVQCPDFIAQERIVYRDDAGRYEAGTPGLAGLAGLDAALDLFLEIGQEAIAQDLRAKRRFLIDRLLGRGMEVLGADFPESNAASIVSFRPRAEDPETAFKRLRRAKVRASLRSDPKGRKYIRFAPHFYNTEAELDCAVEALEA